MTSIRQCLEPFLSTDAGGRIVVEGFDQTCLYFINRADAERRALGHSHIEELHLLRFLLLDAPPSLAAALKRERDVHFLFLLRLLPPGILWQRPMRRLAAAN